jgi:hypothetical protein
MRAKLGIDKPSAPEPTSTEAEALSGDVDDNESTTDEEVSSRDRGTVWFLRKVRACMIERKLSGSVSVSASVGIKTSTAGCDVSPDSAPETFDAEEENSEEAAKYRSKIVGINGALNRLEKKAYVLWRNVSYKEDVSLTEDAIFGIGLGPFALAISVSATATVPSLIASYQRRLASK